MSGPSPHDTGLRPFVVAAVISFAIYVTVMFAVRELGSSQYFQDTMRDPRVGTRNHSGVEPIDVFGFRQRGW